MEDRESHPSRGIPAASNTAATPAAPVVVIRKVKMKPQITFATKHMRQWLF